MVGRTLNSRNGTVGLATIENIDPAKRIELCQLFSRDYTMAFPHGEAGGVAKPPALRPWSTDIGWIGHAAYVANLKASTHA